MFLIVIYGEYRICNKKPTRKYKTIFSTNATNYIAVCGDTKSPCELKIKLFRGDFDLNEKYLYYFKQQLEDDKQIIISQKMDTLFNYLSVIISAVVMCDGVPSGNTI